MIHSANVRYTWTADASRRSSRKLNLLVWNKSETYSGPICPICATNYYDAFRSRILATVKGGNICVLCMTVSFPKQE